MEDSSDYNGSANTEAKESEPVQKGQTLEMSSSPSSPVLRYRRKSLWIPAIYLSLLVVPWIIDCILMYEPYNYQQRYGLSLKHTINSERWLLASLIIARVQTLVAIPVASTLLAQAAVVYSQRTTSDKTLSIRQLLALADRAWAGIPGLWRARHRGVGSRLVTLGGLLILLVSVQPPIQALFASMETIDIVTCLDTPVVGCSRYGIAQEVGFDPEPSDLQFLPSIIPVTRVNSKIIAAADMDQQPHLWPEQWINVDDANAAAKSTLWWYEEMKGYTYFVSSLTNRTSTGILRQLSMRLNSTTSCADEEVSAFPATCSGERPFASDLSLAGVNISICAPGNYEQTPWTLSRDRQDISEELWIQLSLDSSSEGDSLMQQWGFQNWTLHCKTDTTRGYFEIPNAHTNNNPGPLRETWPSREEMASDWNDYLGVDFDYAIPTVWDNRTGPTEWEEPADTYSQFPEPVAPGPLMISTLAMFGNNSWWHAVATGNKTLSIPTNESIVQSLTAICQSAALPFTGFQLSADTFSLAALPCNSVNDGLYSNEADNDTDWQVMLRAIVYGWFSSLYISSVETLDAATFFANEAVLTATADLDFVLGAKWIYTSEGTVFYQPYKSLGGMIAVSLLILLQVIAVLVLVWYTHMTAPVWTDTLNGFAMMRIGAEMAKRGGKENRQQAEHDDDLDQRGDYWELLGTLRFAEEKDLLKLKDVDGLVGVMAGGEELGVGKREMREAPLPGSAARPAGDGVVDGGQKQAAVAVAEHRNEQHAVRDSLLGLGAPGIITRDVDQKKTEKTTELANGDEAV